MKTDLTNRTLLIFYFVSTTPGSGLCVKFQWASRSSTTAAWLLDDSICNSDVWTATNAEREQHFLWWFKESFFKGFLFHLVQLIVIQEGKHEFNRG